MKGKVEGQGKVAMGAGREIWREGKEHVDDFARMISLIEKTP